jgi:predicted MFS family arabinose efflux permease
MSDVPLRVGDPREAGSAAPRHLLPLLCSFSFVLSLNNGLLNPLLPKVVDDLGISITAAGQLATVSLVTCALAALVTGTLSDR